MSIVYLFKWARSIRTHYFLVHLFLFQSLENDDVVVLLVPVFKVVEAFQEMRDRNSNSQALWSFLHIIYCTFIQKKILCNKIESNQSTFSKNSVFEVQRCYTCDLPCWNHYLTFEWVKIHLFQSIKNAETSYIYRYWKQISPLHEEHGRYKPTWLLLFGNKLHFGDHPGSWWHKLQLAGTSLPADEYQIPIKYFFSFIHHHMQPYFP